MKVGIIGCGLVGSTAAYAMLMRGVGREIIMVDVNQERAEAEANDIQHAAPFANDILVRAGEYKDLTGCKAVVITAGVAQRPGETRLQLLQRNANILNVVIPAVLNSAPEAVLVMTTNPVDVMTHLASRYAGKYGVPSNRVIGSGTTLDTARFRALLGLELGIDSSHIHAYVIGEHGDSEVLNWSSVMVGGIQFEEFCASHRKEVRSEKRDEIEKQVRNAAYQIINGKGATYYGIGAALARIVNVILRDQRSILTVCTPLKEIAGVKDVTIAIPYLLGGEGIIDSFPPILDATETKAFQKSAQIIRDAIDLLDNSKNY